MGANGGSFSKSTMVLPNGWSSWVSSFGRSCSGLETSCDSIFSGRSTAINLSLMFSIWLGPFCCGFSDWEFGNWNWLVGQSWSVGCWLIIELTDNLFGQNPDFVLLPAEHTPFLNLIRRSWLSNFVLMLVKRPFIFHSSSLRICFLSSPCWVCFSPLVSLLPDFLVNLHSVPLLTDFPSEKAFFILKPSRFFFARTFPCFSVFFIWEILFLN